MIVDFYIVVFCIYISEVIKGIFDDLGGFEV